MPLPYTVDDPYLQDNLDELDKRTSAFASGSTGNPQNVQNLPLTGAWVNYAGGWSTAGCWKLPDGTVHLQGQITRAGNFATAEGMAVLPVGFRPTLTSVFPIIAMGQAGGVSVSSVYVDLNGNVVYWFGIAGAAANPIGFVSLNGITFKAAI